jgi:hypothetical protein
MNDRVNEWNLPVAWTAPMQYSVSYLLCCTDAVLSQLLAVRMAWTAPMQGTQSVTCCAISYTLVLSQLLAVQSPASCQRAVGRQPKLFEVAIDLFSLSFDKAVLFVIVLPDKVSVRLT